MMTATTQTPNTSAAARRAGWIGMTRRMMGSVATRGRILAMAAVALLGIIVGVVIDRANDTGDFDPTQFLAGFGLVIFVPLVSLVVASASLGNLREERTLAYFWLRPIGRWQISLAATVAGLLVLLPLVLIPMAILSIIVGDSGDVRGLLTASLVGAVGYCCVFTLLGLVTERALAWGLVYILVWEGFIAGLSEMAGRFALSTYTSSVLAQIAGDIEGLESPVAVSTAVIVTAVLAVVCLGLITLRLNRMDVD